MSASNTYDSLKNKIETTPKHHAVLKLQPSAPTNRDKASPIDHFMEGRLSYKQLNIIGEYDLKLPYLNTYHLPNNVVPVVEDGIRHIECYYLMDDGTVKEIIATVADLPVNAQSKNPYDYHGSYMTYAPQAIKAVFITGIKHAQGKFTRTAAHFIVFSQPKQEKETCQVTEITV